MDKIIYMFWTGSNPITEKRKQNYLKTCSVNSTFDVKLLFESDLKAFEKKDNPFHEAYPFLSSVHKADYLRCYFMNFYGGGYSDVKENFFSWENSFNLLNNSEKLICGYQEQQPEHIAWQEDKSLEVTLKQNYFKLIGNGAYICKPNSLLTNEWFDAVNKILDIKLEKIKANPATDPRDYFEKIKFDESISKYPLRWAEICGEVFHRVCYKFNNYVLKDLPRPIMSNYE